MLGSDQDLISSNVVLPNGVKVPNRLVKAAMEEGIGTGGGLPGKQHQRLYARWAQGGWGMIITGNAQVDEKHLATPHDRTIPDTPASVEAYTALLTSILSNVPSNASPPVCLIQISHAGLQSSSTINFSRSPFTPAIGPCSARPDTGSSTLGWVVGRTVWPTPSREIIDFDEWLEIVEKFVGAAKVAEEAGWDGVQIHSAHGYLLAEYLSPLTNPMARPLPGVPASIPNRLHLLYLILKRVHEETDVKFVKAVKINSSDFVQGGLDEDQATEIIKEIVSWKMVDILEISGGNYSSPAFTEMSTSPRQALFSKFTTSLLPSLPSPPKGPAIMLTGGLHSRELIASSLRERACDLVGIGRPACLIPTLPRDVILNPEIGDEQAQVGAYEIPGANTWKWVLGGGGGGGSTSESDSIKTASESGPETVQPATYDDTDTGTGTGTGTGTVQANESTPLVLKQPAGESSTKIKPKSKSKSNGIPLVGAGVGTFWHEWQLCRIGRGVEPDPTMSWGRGLIVEAIWWGLLKGGPLGWWQAVRGR